MRAKLIFNPLSRRAVSSWRLEKLEHRLKKGGLTVKTFRAIKPGEAMSLAASAKDESFDLVICAGGDGTIHRVINGLANSRIPLGILPMGTGNVLAWELDIPFNLFEACTVLASGRTRRIDLCKCNATYFSCMAGVGLDAQVVREINPGVKGLLGTLAYPISALRTLLHYGLPELKIKIDGENQPLLGYGIVLCNSMHYGGRYKICPNASIDDGWMDICILQKKDSYTVIRSGIAMLLEQPLRGKGLKFYRAKSVSVTSPRKVLVQADGDVVEETPVNFSIIPKALSVLVPG